MRDGSVSFVDELIGSFQSAHRLKEQLNYLDQILKNADAFPARKKSFRSSSRRAKRSRPGTSV